MHAVAPRLRYPSIVAAAPRDPFHQATFSGLSAQLFSAIAERGVQIVPASTREVHWYDALTGAVDVRAALQRGRPRLSPQWCWSRRGFDRFSRRLERTISRALPDGGTVLAVGTQARITSPDVRGFCITDATVVQAIDAEEFAVSRVSRRVAAEAIDCQRECFLACEKVFVLSEWAARSVVSDYGYPAERTIVVGAGANLTRMPHDRPREPVVLFVGYDWDRKGGPLLLEAFAQARTRVPDARLVIVGCRPRVSGASVEIIGRLDRTNPQDDARLLELYASSACLALLSRFDPFPNVVLEAAMCGLPTVSTRVGSRPEMIVHDETGLLADDASPASVAEHLVTLLSDGSRAALMGAAARERASSRFTWPLVAQRLTAEMGLGV